jgi:hypothetical protein
MFTELHVETEKKEVTCWAKMRAVLREQDVHCIHLAQEKTKRLIPATQ